MGDIMRFLRAVIIGILAIFPGTIVGFLGWIAVGQSMDNSSLGVTLFCNIVPLGFVVVGFIWSWINGEEYALNYQG